MPEIDTYKVIVDIHVWIKFLALFTIIGWKYHSWIDSFLEQTENDISEDAFFDRIGWESVHTLLQCLDRKQAKKARIERDVTLLDQEINVDSLTAYLHDKFPNRVHSNSNEVSKLVRELLDAGYKSLGDIDRLLEISKDAFALYEKEGPRVGFFTDVGVVRTSASITDKRYRDLRFHVQPDFSRYEKLVKK